MGDRRAGGAVAVLALGLALVGSGRGEPTVRLQGLRPISATTNHAAIVIDTGREVKKFCLAFPEEQISGADALRRVESQVVFAGFSGKGQAVCSLCGTGCPAGDCFCNPDRYWAYHRAGPGGAPYAFSRAGVSATVVRNGDVEGWRWGSGEPPPAATVGEVCDVPEPPARAASSGSSTSTSTTAAAPPPNRPPPATSPPADSSEPPSGGPSAPSPGPASPAPPAPGAAVPGPAGVLAPTAPSDGGSAATGSAPAAAGGAPDATSTDPENSAGLDEAEPDPRDDESSNTDVAADPLAPRPSAGGGPFGGAVGVVAFVALLGGVLVWRQRLRTAAVRRPPEVG